MEYQSAWDNLIEASRYMFRGPSGREVILFLIVLGVAFAVIFIPYFWSKVSRMREIQNSFYSRGLSLGLSREEIGLLWKYARKFPYDPQMIYENKSLFEKIVNRIVRQDISGVRLIPSIRAKLRFDTVPWFIPLSTTRDIDLYQTGSLIVDDTYVDAAVWDKTETELHIVVLGPLPRPVRIGEEVGFHFVREGEGRYSFTSRVIDKYTEGDRLVLVLDHTENLKRVQLRESLRWKIGVPVEFALFEKIEEKEDQGLEFIGGKIEDISTRGVRICTEEILGPREGMFVLMRFSIGSHNFDNLLGEVVNVRNLQSQVCMGVKFFKLSRKEERIIDRFIMDQQRKLIKAYKVGELE